MICSSPMFHYKYLKIGPLDLEKMAIKGFTIHAYGRDAILAI